MMLKKTVRELALAAKEIGRALKGLDQVSFHLGMSVHNAEDEHPLITTQVTLWFGQHFQVKIQGGEDIVWLAKECRRKAESNLEKLSEIAKATNGKPSCRSRNE